MGWRKSDTALNDSVLERILGKGKELITNETAELAQTVTEKIQPQIKSICYEGSKVAIKEYSVPIVTGVAVFTIAVFGIGVAIGKWLDDKGEKK